MTVRSGLLAILDQGRCYGYQLRTEYARRTGQSLNVGQIYTTLDRLERDGLVAKQGTDDRGHTSWGITPEGRREAQLWLSEADAPVGRNERAVKIALASTLPGVDTSALIAAERAAATARLSALEDEDRPEDVPSAVLREAERARLVGEIAWLDAVGDLVRADGPPAAFALSDERPRRGRPARAGQTG
ncbi:PadR family transcriptional regulator [Microbacterium sp. RD1]|uniref:PadR family transcriptional regulator n=1 Tax=Microbacterium sp. RD1 TaxID=3457313 RepID=UPI003FA561E0